MVSPLRGSISGGGDPWVRSFLAHPRLLLFGRYATAAAHSAAAHTAAAHTTAVHTPAVHTPAVHTAASHCLFNLWN